MKGKSRQRDRKGNEVRGRACGIIVGDESSIVVFAGQTSPLPVASHSHSLATLSLSPSIRLGRALALARSWRIFQLGSSHSPLSTGVDSAIHHSPLEGCAAAGFVGQQEWRKIFKLHREWYHPEASCMHRLTKSKMIEVARSTIVDDVDPKRQAKPLSCGPPWNLP